MCCWQTHKQKTRDQKKKKKGSCCFTFLITTRSWFISCVVIHVCIRIVSILISCVISIIFYFICLLLFFFFGCVNFCALIGFFFKVSWLDLFDETQNIFANKILNANACLLKNRHSSKVPLLPKQNEKTNTQKKVYSKVVAFRRRCFLARKSAIFFYFTLFLFQTPKQK